jgi:hypothetical protein
MAAYAAGEASHRDCLLSERLAKLTGYSNKTDLLENWDDELRLTDFSKLGVA